MGITAVASDWGMLIARVALSGSISKRCVGGVLRREVFGECK